MTDVSIFEFILCGYCGRSVPDDEPHECQPGITRQPIKFVPYGTKCLDNLARSLRDAGLAAAGAMAYIKERQELERQAERG
mgnify:FL=1